MRLSVLACSLFSLLLSLPLMAADDIPETPVDLGAQSFQADDGQTYLALNYDNYPEWHTYWKNPGDAGLPIEKTFLLDGEEIEISSLEWPAPKRYFEDGDILAYGYSNDYSLFFRPTPDQLNRWEGRSFEIKSQWLVCRHLCIPGRGEVHGQWRGGEFIPEGNVLQVSTSELKKRLDKIPQQKQWPVELDIVLAKSHERDEELILYYTYSRSETALNDTNLITPFPEELLGFRREHLYEDQQGYLYGRIRATWDGDFAQPAVSFPTDGNFDSPIHVQFLFANPVTGKTELIERSFERFSLDHAQRAEALLAGLEPVDNQTIEVPTEPPSEGQATSSQATTQLVQDTGTSQTGLFYYLLFAFIGGFILNFMPCVLPVISLKLFDLIRHRQENRATILKHNLAYTLGVLGTFILLALAVVGLKSTGEVIGWGFQLQSPRFVGILIIVLFIMTLNLFGLFEFMTPGGKQLGNVHLKKGFTGDVGSGALATILATPCSAPFLGTALTFAFAANTLTILLVFTTIGVGLALPFIVTGFFPQLINFLPKPGMWMEKLKKFLGLTLILTGLWLADIFLALTDGTGNHMMLMAALIFIFFFFFSRRTISKNPVFQTILFLIAATFSLQSLYSAGSEPMGGGSTSTAMNAHGEIEKAGMMWESFSEEKLEQLREEGEIAFINFTAQWCVTCKVMERVVMDTAAFRQMIQDNNARLVIADWTRREAHIGEWLEEHGMVGIPAYFVLRSDGTLVNLGETITVERVRRNLQ